jgi:phenylpropionate dioxygenase-like ring-hydroxylating dioxygenase large terminal subunit
MICADGSSYVKGTSVQGAPREGRRTPSEGREDARRLQLIEATVATIAKRGYARTTLAHVTDQAKLSRGIANFYFKSKEALLLATLRHLIDDYRAFWRRALAEAGPSAADRIEALIRAEFHPRICRRERVAAWFAFWGEARTRRAYSQVCAAADLEHFKVLSGLVQDLIDAHGPATLRAEAVASGLGAMMSGFLQDYMLDADHFDRATARRTCVLFLAGMFPAAFDASSEAAAPTPRPRRARAEPAGAASASAAETLPAWTYNDPAFHALERSRIFRRTWQFVCHANDVAEPGAYASLAFAGERVFVVRGRDGVIRGFHNTCRHRAACVATGSSGRFARAIVCPYHGWTYDLDGRLALVPGHETFPHLDRAAFGLVAVEVEVWQGLVFVRLGGTGPTVATLMAPYAAELLPYRIAEMRGERPDFWVADSAADWKNVMDNYLEGYHIPIGHPGLQRLFGGSYRVETAPHGVARAFSVLRGEPSRAWSERAYQRLLPEVADLPQGWRRAWVYYSLFPSTTINVAPHAVNLFQILPAGPGRTVVRGRNYVLPDDRRSMRAARWLGSRINARVYREDDALVRSVQGGLESGAYEAGRLAETEVCLRRFHDEIRAAIPAARERARPTPERMAAIGAMREREEIGSWT